MTNATTLLNGNHAETTTEERKETMKKANMKKANKTATEDYSLIIAGNDTIPGFKKIADIARAERIRLAREQEEREQEEFDRETEEMQLKADIERAEKERAEEERAGKGKTERFCKTRSPNKELQQLLAIQRHQSQMQAWIHRKQKYGDSGYKAGHSPLKDRKAKGE